MPRSKPVAKRAAQRSPVDLHDVEALVAVVEAGSFTLAASRSGLPKSALSRRVARLEQTLGVRLLQRTTRSLSLTEAGSEYARRTSLALAELREAGDVVTEANDEAAGLVRVTAPADLSSMLAPALLRFEAQHPKVVIEVDLSNRFVDLVTEGFDLAVRAGRLRDSSLVVRTLGSSAGVLVASPAYLARRGAPASPGELDGHDCLAFRSQSGKATWELVGPEGEVRVEVRGRLGANDFTFLRAAALHDGGIALLPLGACYDDIVAGRLVGVMPGYHGLAGAIHLVYPSARFLPQRVVLLRDFLLRELKLPTVEEVARLCTKSQPSAVSRAPAKRR